MFHKSVRIIGKTDTGCQWHIVIFILFARYLLYQQCHLLILIKQVPLFPIFKSRGGEGAGIYFSYGLFKFKKPLLKRALIGAEYGLIFSGKGVSESVFQETSSGVPGLKCAGRLWSVLFQIRYLNSIISEKHQSTVPRYPGYFHQSQAP